MVPLTLKAQLERDEGRQSTAYRDSVKGIWTIGIGHTGNEVYEGLVWSDSKIDAVFAMDLQAASGALDIHLQWLPLLSPVRIDALRNMTFQMGIGGLLGFHHMLEAMRVGRWLDAFEEARNSKWALQTPARALRIASQILTNVRQ